MAMSVIILKDMQNTESGPQNYSPSFKQINHSPFSMETQKLTGNATNGIRNLFAPLLVSKM